MDTTEYIKNCIEQIKADYIDTEGHFEFGMFNSKGLVAMNIMIFPEEQTITTYAIMGYWVPEEKRETVLDLIQPDDGYDVKITLLEGSLYGESTCKIQENRHAAHPLPRPLHARRAPPHPHPRQKRITP